MQGQASTEPGTGKCIASCQQIFAAFVWWSSRQAHSQPLVIQGQHFIASGISCGQIWQSQWHLASCKMHTPRLELLQRSSVRKSIPFWWFDCRRKAAYFKHLVLQWPPECSKADQRSHRLFFGSSLLPHGSLWIAHLLSSFSQHQVLLQMELKLSWLILPLKSVPTRLQVSDTLPIQTAAVSSGSGHACWSSRAWIQTLEVSMEKFLFVSALDLVPSSQHCAEYEPGSCWRQYLMQHHVTALDSLSSGFKTQNKCFTDLPMVIQEHKMGIHFLESSRLIPSSFWRPCHSNLCINLSFGGN